MTPYTLCHCIGGKRCFEGEPSLAVVFVFPSRGAASSKLVFVRLKKACALARSTSALGI